MSLLRNHLLLPPNRQLYHQSSQPDLANQWDSGQHAVIASRTNN